MGLAVPVPDVYGAFLVALVVSAVFFGMTNLQAFFYYQSYRNDPLLFKYWVAIIWTLDALTLACELHAVYFYLVSNFGDVIALAFPVWSLKLQGVLGLILIPFVQSLYVFRLWKLYDGRKLIPILIGVAMLGGWSSIIPSMVQINASTTLLHVSSYYKRTLSTSFAFAAVNDILSCAALCYALYQPKRSLTCTGSLLRDIVLWTIGSGVLTSIITVAAFVTFTAAPLSPVWISLAMVMFKLYTNCCLAMLNVRQNLRSNLPEQVRPSSTLDRLSTYGEMKLPLPTHSRQSSYSGNLESSFIHVERGTYFVQKGLPPVPGHAV